MAKPCHPCRPLLWGLLILSSAAPQLVAEAVAAPQKQVLTLYATRRDAQVAVLGDREFPRLLESGLAEPVDYYGEYLDLARFRDPEYQASVRTFLQEKYVDHDFDLIIAMHDIALEFIALYHGELFPGVPVAFLSTEPDVRRLPNSAGVIAPIDFGGTLRLAAALHPGVRHVVVVAGAAPRDREHEQQARRQFQAFEDRFSFTYLSGLPTRELESRLAALPVDTIVYYLLVNWDGEGESFHPLDYLGRVARVASVPVYCWTDSALDRGVVGGNLRTQSKQVESMADLAIRILGGEPPDGIPVVRPDFNQPQVDWRQLRRWDISEARVPPGTLVRFREPSVWDRYKVHIVSGVAVLLLQTVLIAGLLIQRIRRHHAEVQLRTSERELRDSYDRIRDLAGRLLTAQDDERARIARDLHDDVSQQLALLTSDLELLSGLSERESGDVADGALRRLDAISRAIRELSYQLHPAKLRLIGLVPSLVALEREVSTQGPQVTFTHDDVPRELPPDLALCLYRVVQEALRNVARHSRARQVRMHLQGGQDALGLTITDDGVGFVPVEALGRGLGLVSMRERLEVVGGGFDVESAPGKGTTVWITVPLRTAASEKAAVS